MGGRLLPAHVLQLVGRPGARAGRGRPPHAGLRHRLRPRRRRPGDGDGPRARAVARGRPLVHLRADEGVPGFVQLVAEGHDAKWRANAEHAAAQLPAWLGAVTS